MSRISEEIKSGLFLRKVNGLICDNRYVAKCPSCNKEISVKINVFGKRRALISLARFFNTCTECGKYYCDDCYIIITDNRTFEGICLTCADSLGISGLTTTEFLKGVPLSDKQNQSAKNNRQQ